MKPRLRYEQQISASLNIPIHYHYKTVEMSRFVLSCPIKQLELYYAKFILVTVTVIESTYMISFKCYMIYIFSEKRHCLNFSCTSIVLSKTLSVRDHEEPVIQVRIAQIF